MPMRWLRFFMAVPFLEWCLSGTPDAHFDFSEKRVPDSERE
jgi:hypothetical protein